MSSGLPIVPPATANPLRPGTQVELTRHLADTIGSDVIAAMDKNGWDESVTHITPVQADPAGAPSTEPVSPSPAPQANPAGPEVTPKAGDTAPTTTPSESTFDWESLRGANGLIADKWKDPVAASRGVHDLIRYAKSALTERDQLKQQLHESQTRQSAAPPVLAPAEPVRSAAPKRDEVLSRLNEKYSLEPDDLNALVQVVADEAGLRAKQVVEDRLSSAEREQRDWHDVDAYMKDKYPDSIQHSDEINLFVQTNPEVLSEVSTLISAGNRRGAARHAWLAYRAENPNTQAIEHEQQLRAAEQVRTEEVDRARKDAGLISTQATGVHESAPAGPTEEERQKAIGLYNAGVKEPWLRMAFGSQLTGPYFE